jgi:Neuraminidase (sialidase)
MTEVRSQASEVSSDTLREQVTVVILDTIKEITTITVRESETGDTLRMTTVTDRTRASTKDRYHDVQEKVIEKTDTVYVERQADKQTVVTADPNVEMDKEGNVTRKVNRISQTLKWVFFVALAIAVLLVVLKLYRR